MANLTENTQYGSNGVQSGIANLSGIMKGLQTKSGSSSANTVKSAIASQVYLYIALDFHQIFH